MITGNNRFVFVCPYYNAAKTLKTMLHSVCGQSYENWKIILIDDVSDASNKIACDKIIDKFHDLCDDYDLSDEDRKIQVIWNDTKQWEVANVLKGIAMCDDEDVICRIDGDDWLTDMDALAIIDAAYRQTGADVVWTKHRWAFSDKNISGPMPENADPYAYPWVTSHLKCFRKRLINGVNDENFRGEDGNYIRRAGDQCIMLPVLHNTKKRVFVDRVCYHYTIKDSPATYQTDDAKFQRDEALFLRKRGYLK